jgi:serine/threonine protein kinase
MALRRGERLGVYEVIEPVGAGGMGEVYRARDTALGRDAALKVLPDRLVDDPNRRTRFEREARLLAQLHHPHIALVYGFETCDSVSYLAMEFVPGQTPSSSAVRCQWTR